MLLKPAAAQAVSEVSKKGLPTHPTFLFLGIAHWNALSSDKCAKSKHVLNIRSMKSKHVLTGACMRMLGTRHPLL